MSSSCHFLESYESQLERKREEMTSPYEEQEQQAKANIEERALENKLLDDIFETWKAGD